MIDSHCHLDHEPLFTDLPNVLQRSRDVGIKKLLTISTSLKSFSRVKELVNRDEMIFGTIGIHPHESSTNIITANEIIDNLKDNKIRLKDRKSKFEYSDYQKSERDFAFVVDKKIKAQDLLEIITSIDKDLIKSVKVFDVYEGENIPSDKKSIALNVTIQSSDKTLDDNDLEKINNLIISTVENKSGAKIRS